MVYLFVKWLAKLTFSSYFRTIFIKGDQHLDTTGPVIFVANHPSSFMDPMVVATAVRRPIHFIAAAEFFGKRLKAWIFREQLHMIPIYRPNALPEDVHRNSEIFIKCFDLFEKGGGLLVFPEGNSITEKRIRKLKTGVARMALGAIKDRAIQDVIIIPIGLNYTNPHRFRSELFINVGRPISALSFLSDPDAVKALTQSIEEHLKATSLHISDDSLDELIKKVLILEINNLRNDPKWTIDHALLMWQNLVKSITLLKEQSALSISNFETLLNWYLKKIKKLRISDTTMAETNPRITFLQILRLILCLPIAIIGFILNAIPYYLTIFVFRKMNLFERKGFKPKKIKLNAAFKGSVGMAIGMLIFISYYILLGVVNTVLFGSILLTIVAIPLTYATGLLTLRFLNWVYSFGQKLRIKKLWKIKKVEMEDLVKKRTDLSRQINQMIEDSVPVG